MFQNIKPFVLVVCQKKFVQRNKMFYLRLNQSILDLSSFKKHLSERLFFRYFPPKNSSIEQLFNDFLKKTSEKIAIPYKHFLKKNKSIYKHLPI